MSSTIKIQNIEIDRTIAFMLIKELGHIIELLNNSNEVSADNIPKILVALHRLKGSSGFIGLKEIEDGARESENKIKTTSHLNLKDNQIFLTKLKDLFKEINDALC